MNSLILPKLTRKLDIYVSDGKIVKPSKYEVSDFKKTYDAKGMYVMAGAIERLLLLVEIKQC